MTKLKPKHLDPLAAQLDYIAEEMRLTRNRLELRPEPLDKLMEMLGDQYSILVTMRREMEKRTLTPDLERVETLLAGVRTALERMGGNVLPGFVTDVHALRDQMAELRQEMAGYRSTLMRLTNWLDLQATQSVDAYEPKSKPKQRRRRRSAQSDLPLGEPVAIENPSPQKDGENGP